MAENGKERVSVPNSEPGRGNVVVSGGARSYTALSLGPR